MYREGEWELQSIFSLTFFFYYSLFIIHYSLFIIHYSLANQNKFFLFNSSKFTSAFQINSWNCAQILQCEPMFILVTMFLHSMSDYPPFPCVHHMCEYPPRSIYSVISLPFYVYCTVYITTLCFPHLWLASHSLYVQYTTCVTALPLHNILETYLARDLNLL